MQLNIALQKTMAAVCDGVNGTVSPQSSLLHLCLSGGLALASPGVSCIERRKYEMSCCTFCK
jgi:hypothetical protein